MGKAARLKKEKKERALREQETMKNFEVTVNRDVDYLMTIRSEVLLRGILNRFPEKILTLFADIIIQRSLEEVYQDYEERYAKGERNVVAERHGHLLSWDGFTPQQMLGVRRRRTFYATKTRGVVTVDHPEESYEIPGHLLPYVFSYEWLCWGRWEYWMDVMQKGNIEETGPIPQITWCNDPYIIRTVLASLRDCVNYGRDYGCTLEDFADWILFGLNAAPKHPEIPPEVNLYWIKAFDMLSMIRYPHDYLTPLLIEWYASNVEEEKKLSLETLELKDLERKVEIEFTGKNPEELKKMEIYVEEVGCGTALLPYSNYTFFAGGGVQDPLAMKLNKIQMMLYAPWYAQNTFREEVKQRYTPVDLKELIIALVLNEHGDEIGQPRIVMIGQKDVTRKA
jgi:hypothetical protein